MNKYLKISLGILALLTISLVSLYGYGYFKYGIQGLYGQNGIGKIPARCVHCQAPNRFDAKYCVKCNLLTYQNLKCSKCGYENILSDTLCVGCGAKNVIPWDIKFRLKCHWMKKAAEGNS